MSLLEEAVWEVEGRTEGPLGFAMTVIPSYPMAGPEMTLELM